MLYHRLSSQLFTFNSYILSKSPVAYWKMNEASGTVANDYSGNNHDGTYLGNFNYTAPSTPGPSLSNGVVFNGSDTYISCDSVIPLLQQSYTFVVWVLSTVNVTGQMAFMCINRDMTGPFFNRFLFMVGGGNRIRVYDEEASTTSYGDDNNITDGNWHMLTITLSFSGSTSVINTYVDNNKQAGDFPYTTTTLPKTTDRFSIGQDFDGTTVSDVWDGSMTEAALFDYVFTDADVNSMYQSGISF